MMLCWTLSVVSVRAHSFPWFAYRINIAVYNTEPMKRLEAAAHFCKLLWA